MITDKHINAIVVWTDIREGTEQFEQQRQSIENIVQYFPDGSKVRLASSGFDERERKTIADFVVGNGNLTWVHRLREHKRSNEGNYASSSCLNRTISDWSSDRKGPSAGAEIVFLIIPKSSIIDHPENFAIKKKTFVVVSGDSESPAVGKFADLATDRKHVFYSWKMDHKNFKDLISSGK